MSVHKEYQGHRNYNAWNVSIWLFNEEAFYRPMRELMSRRCKGYTTASVARGLLAYLPYKTPDGVPFTYTNVRLALRDWEK